MDTPLPSRETPAVALTLKPNVWKETYPIRTYEVDCCNRLSIPSMFNFMQDAASKHAQALGVSVQRLLAEAFYGDCILAAFDIRFFANSIKPKFILSI